MRYVKCSSRCLHRNSFFISDSSSPFLMNVHPFKHPSFETFSYSLNSFVIIPNFSKLSKITYLFKSKDTFWEEFLFYWIRRIARSKSNLTSAKNKQSFHEENREKGERMLEAWTKHWKHLVTATLAGEEKRKKGKFVKTIRSVSWILVVIRHRPRDENTCTIARIQIIRNEDREQ